MNRIVVVASLLLGTLTGCDVFFPSGARSGALTGTGPDGGVCEKDPQTIKNVMLAPPTCNATNPCPCGTFCSSQTGGNCVADCVDNSWCSPGYTCSGYGQCLAATDGGASDGGGGPGPNVDPACPRNEALLTSLTTMNRSCQFDDTCPFGSYCDHVKERCWSDCRTNSDCTSLNTPGHTFVCGCLGKCAEVAVPRVPATEVLSTIEVTPDEFTFTRPAAMITQPNWGDTPVTAAARAISVVVVAPFVTMNGTTITGPSVSITANPGPGLMVACPGASSATASPCPFTVDPTTFKLKNGVYRSDPLTLTLKPSPMAPTQTSWELRLNSNQISNSPKSVPLRYAEAVDSTVAPNYQSNPTLDPAFRGTGYVTIETPTLGRLSIPVKARVWSTWWEGTINKLVVFDETRQLSPSGRLVLALGTDTPHLEAFIEPDGDNDVDLQASLRGSLMQRLSAFSLQRETNTGALNGTFSRTVSSDYVFNQSPSGAPTSPFARATSGNFTLTPTSSTAGFCTSNSDCSGGTTCSVGFCADGGTHHSYFQTSTSTVGVGVLDHKHSSTWGLKYSSPDAPGGFSQGFQAMYIPYSGYLNQIAYFLLDGPLPIVSGEANADGFTSDGTQLLFDVHQFAMPFLIQGDSTYGPSRSQLLADCLTDLERDRQSNNLVTDTYDSYAPCINLGRVNQALGDHRTSQRTLQGWLQLHSFIAREGLEEAKLQDTTGGTGIPGGGSSASAPPIEKILGAVESGLGFTLDLNSRYQYATYFKMSPAEIWSTIDYRRDMFMGCSNDNDCNVHGSTEPGQKTMFCDTNQFLCQVYPASTLPQHEQPVGVPPVLIETATAYLRVLEAYLERIARTSYGAPADASPSNSRAAALRRFGTGMRLVLAAEQMAVGINVKAGACPASNPNCAFIQKRFDAAIAELNAVRPRVMAQAEIIRSGRNPFNIPEDDVPLFFGDPAGASSQYFAASDYLINGWAIPAVAQAQSYLDAARAGWIAQLQAKVQDELNQHNREQEVNQLMSKYGSPILSACGNIQVRDGKGNLRQLDSTEVIPYYSAAGVDVDSSSCFIEQACTGDEGVDGKIALNSVLNNAYWDPSKNNGAGGYATTEDRPGLQDTLGSLFVRDEVCKLTYFTQGLPNNKFINFVKGFCPANVAWSPPNGTYCGITRGYGDRMYLSSPMGFIPLAAFYGPIKRSDIQMSQYYWGAFNGPGPDDNIYNFEEVRSILDLVKFGGAVLTVREAFASMATPYCAGASKAHLLHADYPRPEHDAFPGRCYKGDLGVAYHQVSSNLLRIKRAKEVLDGGQKGLKDQMLYCSQIDMNNANLAYHTAHYNEMADAYQLVSGVAGSAEKGVQVGMSTGNVYAGIAAGVAAFGLSLFGNAVEDEARELQQMEVKFGRDEKALECWNTFRAQRRSLATAMTDVQIAASELESQMAVFRNLAGEIARNMQEGKAVLAREQSSPLSSLGHHFWVDEKVEQFRKEFEWSRRLAFLAMRAVEYEFQQSLPFRSQIVSAANPAQLQDVMTGLRQEQAARTINRRRPDEASVVVSLRDDVLAISDRSQDPAGERNWTPAERFASRLWDDRYAYRDSSGEYLGQAIPFTLGPTGVLETRCGERLWRATATVQGDGIETSAPGASVLLLKRNTFSSQYCDGKSPPRTDSSGAVVPGPKMQVGVVHTSAQLFRPGANVDLSDANQFTAAMLYPWFNVRRTDFYKTSYQDGASEELAGRGLYGDYVLLFPKQLLEEGFSLDRVEDVLLRLDYLSVDNLSQ